MPTYLARYVQGEYEQVWRELGALGPTVREEPILIDAYAVACETMRRAGENVRRIIARLGQIGYRFEHAPLGTWQPNQRVHTPPAPDVARQVAALQAMVGPLPLSLRAWYEIVGDVNLMGRHPAWDERACPDPLVVEGLSAWDSEYADWRDQREEGGGDEPFVLPFAPDYYHKANVSGGSPYGVVLPCPSADAPVAMEWHETTFVDYLRVAFRWGGFPGWERLDLGQPRGKPLPKSARPVAHLAHLSADLLPF